MARRWRQQFVYADDARELVVTVTEWDGGTWAYFVEEGADDYDCPMQIHEQYDPPFETVEQAIEAAERWLDEKYGKDGGEE